MKSHQNAVKNESKFQKAAESLAVQGVDGFLRCKGRLGRSNLPFDAKHPLLLPTYKTVYHDGVKETLTEFRSCYTLFFIRKLVIILVLDFLKIFDKLVLKLS